MKLSDLAPAVGAKKKEKRIGHGPGSGHGKTSTKGHKGQAARSGGTKAPGFEGGQQPLLRRIPKGGFTNIFKKKYAIVALSRLCRFESGSSVGPAELEKARIIKNAGGRIKILGDIEMDRPLIVSAHHFSKSAVQKIEAAGGRAERLEFNAERSSFR